MENLKVYVETESESEEVQKLFFELGFEWFEETKRKIHADRIGILFTTKFVGVQYLTYDKGREFSLVNHKELTIPQLRDLVVLKRNDIRDATHKYHGCLFYVDSEGCLYQHMTTMWFKQSNEHWNLEEIKKHKIEKEMKMKEYLGLQEDGSYKLVIRGDEGSTTDIKVPEGAEIFLLDASCGKDVLYFVKHDGEVFHEYYTNTTDLQNNAWIKGTIKVLHEGMGKVLWKRNLTKTDTSIQEKLKFINKDVEVKKKEFLNPEQYYALVECFVGETRIPSSWIEVPEGVEEYRANYKFYKNNGELFYSSLLFEWTKSSMPEYITLWQRNPTTLDSVHTVTQDKLKFIEKWLNGEKIQYILGIESEKTQWHNFTEGAMQYIKRPDIKFREAPKYVTINGVEFKSIEKLLKHVKNNFDLEDGE